MSSLSLAKDKYKSSVRKGYKKLSVDESKWLQLENDQLNTANTSALDLRTCHNLNAKCQCKIHEIFTLNKAHYTCSTVSTHNIHGLTPNDLIHIYN